MAGIQAREQKEHYIGDDRFMITAFEAFHGLQVLTRLQDTIFQGFSAPPELIREMICKSCTVNGSQITDKNFNQIFSKKYKSMMELFSEIVKFNYEDLMTEEGEEGSPNDQSDTSET